MAPEVRPEPADHWEEDIRGGHKGVGGARTPPERVESSDQTRADWWRRDVWVSSELTSQTSSLAGQTQRIT